MAEDLAVKVAEIDQRSKSNTHRINELAGQIDAVNRLAVAVEVMATEQKHQTGAIESIKKDVASLDAKVENIEQKPAKRWEAIVEKAILLIVAGVIGYLLAQLGLG